MASATSTLQRWGCRCVSSLSSSLRLRSSSSSLSSALQQQQQQQKQHITTASASSLRRITPTASTTFTAPFSTKAPAAKKGKKGGDEGGGGGGGGGAEAPVGDVTKVAPVNIHKDGKDPPLLPDDQYPEWLFEIRPLTLPEYRKMDISKLPLKEQRRYWKLLNRQVIKEKNAAGQKL